MERKEIIKEAFDKEIDRLFMEKPTIHHFLKTHERYGKCIDNLNEKAFEMEMSNAFRLEKKHLEYMGKSYAQTFSMAALEFAEKKHNETAWKLKKESEAKEAGGLVDLSDEIKEVDSSYGIK